MNNWMVRLVGAGLALGMVAAVSGPAIAQDSGIANTAEDFKSADSNDGILGSDMDIWDIFHQAGALNGVGVVDAGFYRNQGRRINSQAESLRERQRAILQQRNESAPALTATPAE
ncbi:hypothetical protein BH23CYA1_BH23CYA1_04640 [soil metagenome]